MKKDFTRWHLQKTKISNEGSVPLFHEREVWWCALGTNVGVEEDGKNELHERPVLVYRKFSSELLYTLPTTSRSKTGPYYCSYHLNGADSFVILTQLKSISSKRLLRRVGRISWDQFRHVDESFHLLLNKTDPLRDPRVPGGNLH